jgi:hypothetical protein
MSLWDSSCSCSCSSFSSVAPTWSIGHPWNVRFTSASYSKTVGRTPSMGEQSVARPVPNTNKAAMPWVGFEPTIPVFERAKTIHVIDGEATVMGPVVLQCVNLPNFTRITFMDAKL